MEFKFNLIKARRTIASLLMLSLILVTLLLITENSLSLIVLNRLRNFVVFLIGYSVVLFFLFWRLRFFFKNTNLKIVVGDNSVSIPNLFVGTKKIFIKDIYSLEEISIKGKLVSLILGIKDKGRSSIDLNRFVSNEEFLLFTECLKNFSKKNQNLGALESLENISIKNGVIFPFFTSFFCLVLVAIYVLLLRGVSDEIEMPKQFLIGAGTKNIFESFEFYRVFSSVFLHVSGWHLLINIFVLGLMGELFERVLSAVRFINVFFLSGLVAYLFFVVFSEFEMGVGASGCIYGLWGAYFHLKFHYEECLPGSVNAISFRNLVWVLISQLILEIFIIRNTGYVAHIGGFLAGYMLLFCMPIGNKLEKVNKPILVEKLLCSILSISYAGGLIYFFNLYFAHLNQINSIKLF